MAVNDGSVREMWQFASACHFFQVFRSCLGSPAFGPDDLEAALSAPSLDLSDGRALINVLHKKLLLAIGAPGGSKTLVEWPRHLKKVLDQLSKDDLLDDWDEGHPLKDASDYGALTARDKALILYNLCLRAVDSVEELKEQCAAEPDKFRGHPIGADVEGSSYFRFSNDCWLFRLKEHPSMAKKRKVSHPGEWQVACSTLPELRELLSELGQSRNTQQRQLTTYIEKQVLQDVEAAEAAKERAALKRDRVMYAPRRQSSRVARKRAEAEAEAEKRRHIEEAERAEQEEIERSQAEERQSVVEHGRELRAQRREEALSVTNQSQRQSRSMRYLRRVGEQDAVSVGSEPVDEMDEVEQTHRSDSISMGHPQSEREHQNEPEAEAGIEPMRPAVVQEGEMSTCVGPSSASSPVCLPFQSPPPPEEHANTYMGMSSAATMSSTKVSSVPREADAMSVSSVHVGSHPHREPVDVDHDSRTSPDSPPQQQADTPGSPACTSSQVLSTITIPRHVGISTSSSIASQVTSASQNSPFSVTSASTLHRQPPVRPDPPPPPSVHMSNHRSPTPSTSTASLLSPSTVQAMPPVAPPTAETAPGEVRPCYK